MAEDAGPRRRAGRLTVRSLALFAGVVLALMLGASPASAHALLIASTPRDGTVLVAAPAEVALTFSEPVQVVAGGVAVTGPDGGRVDDGVVRRPGDAAVTVRLPGLRVRAQRGTYTVTWRVISADSHPVGGALTFSIGAPSRPVPARTLHTTRSVGITFGVARFAAFAGFAVLIGAAAICGYGGPQVAAQQGIRRLLVGAWATLVIATVTALLLQGPYAAGRGLAQAGRTGPLVQTLHSRYGTALALRILLSGLVPVLLVLAGRRILRGLIAAMAALIGVGLAATWTVAGHAGTGTHEAAAMTADVVHLLAASLWVGGLVALAVLLRRAEPAQVAAGRFSRLALVCVTVLVVTGLVQAWLRVETPSAVFTTAYGRLLTVKVTVLILVLSIAYQARARLRRIDRPGVRLGRLVAAETVGAAALLALTAVLVQSPPAAQAYAARPVTLSVPFQAGRDAGRISVRLPNATRGVADGDVTISAPDGHPRDVLEITASWTQPRLRIGPLPVRFTRSAAGRWRASWPPLPATGTWRLAVTVRTTDIDETAVRAEMRIR